jgi:hypothetical protein
MKDIYVKNNLGNAYLHLMLLFVSVVMLHAEDFTYTFNIDKPAPYVKEPVILTLDLNQTNHDVVMLFNFNIKKSKDYTFQRIDIQETDSYHDAKVRYIYLLYPLRAGDINITFDLLQKTTTDESVAYSFSGDRDNVKGMVTVDTKIDLPPLQIQVKPLPEGTLLVGDFSMTHMIKKQKAKSHEPLPMQVSIKGTGYPPLLDSLLPKEGNFTRFREKPIVKSFSSTEGTQSTVTYPLALSHTKSFTLAPIVLKAFNPQTEKIYTLEIPAQAFEIQEVDALTLVDKIDSPEVLKADWSWLSTLLSYIVVFTAGYLTALSWKWGKRQKHKEDHPLIQKIQACKDEKALLQVLMASRAKHFTAIIEKVENSLYGNGKINFNKIKQDALDRIMKEEQI